MNVVENTEKNGGSYWLMAAHSRSYGLPEKVPESIHGCIAMTVIGSFKINPKPFIEKYKTALIGQLGIVLSRAEYSDWNDL